MRYVLVVPTNTNLPDNEVALAMYRLSEELEAEHQAHLAAEAACAEADAEARSMAAKYGWTR